MRTNHALAAMLVAVSLSGTCLAQDEAPGPFAYSTYYVCDAATQNDMDEIVEQYEKPVFDRYVEEGKLIAWGYLAHSTGGRWRRAQFHVSPTLADAVGNQAAIFEEIYGENPAAGQARAEACEAHDDYIWMQGAGSSFGEERGAVSLSAYHVCDQARESRADEIGEQLTAPVLDRLVEEGKLSSWGWLHHNIGGKYRRLSTMTGASHEAVLAARAELIAELSDDDSGLGDEFSDICSSHTDYLWDIVHESP